MVDPVVRGHGIASHLNDLAHLWFAEQEADALIALVDGYSQSSSQLFQSRGYRRLTVTEELRAFGAGTLRVWLASGLPSTVPLAPAAILGVPAVLIGVRTLVLVLVARARRLEVRFDAWTGGLCCSDWQLALSVDTCRLRRPSTRVHEAAVIEYPPQFRVHNPGDLGFW